MPLDVLGAHYCLELLTKMSQYLMVSHASRLVPFSDDSIALLHLPPEDADMKWIPNIRITPWAPDLDVQFNL